MNPDNIEPIPFLLLMALIVGAWLILGIRDRRRRRAEWRAFEALIARWDAAVRVDACAHVWTDAGAWHVCTIRYEHTGPHLDREHEAIHR